MTKNDAYVSFQRVQKSYDGETLVIKNLNLDTERGEFLTMLGPSGSGKTTCLMMLAGFETATHGEIILDGIPINNVPPQGSPPQGGAGAAQSTHPCQRGGPPATCHHI